MKKRRKEGLNPKVGGGEQMDDLRHGRGQYRGLGELSSRSRLKEHTAEHWALETALRSSGKKKGITLGTMTRSVAWATYWGQATDISEVAREAEAGTGVGGG